MVLERVYVRRTHPRADLIKKWHSVDIIVLYSVGVGLENEEKASGIGQAGMEIRLR